MVFFHLLLLFLLFFYTLLVSISFLVVNLILQSSLGDHTLQIEGTSKPMASPEDLSASENSKTPIGATTMSTCPLVTKASPQRVGGTEPITTSEISHFCADNLISDLR